MLYEVITPASNEAPSANPSTLASTRKVSSGPNLSPASATNQEPDEAQAMEALETRLLADLGIADPHAAALFHGDGE